MKTGKNLNMNDGGKYLAILDSDLLVAFLRKKANGYEVIEYLKGEQLELKTTVFNAAELYNDCYSMRNVAKVLNKVKSLLENLSEMKMLFKNMQN